jgi:hypothetical protein
LPEALGRLLSIRLNPLFGGDEGSEESWQLITNIHVEFDIHVDFVSANHKFMDTFLSGGFCFAGTNRILTFKVLLWSFLCYLIHLNPFIKQYGA